MTLTEYRKLPPEEQKQYQTTRICWECEGFLVRDSHSMGNMHAVCPSCDMCPDCEDGE